MTTLLQDFFVIFYWWVLLFGLGLLGLPLSWYFFKKFFDRGYLFSKVFSILILGYILWLLASFQILPFYRQSIWFLVFLFAGFNFFFFKKHFSEIKSFFKEHKKFIILEEIIFFLALFFWAFVRGFQPAIEGLEKFMDFGFLNAILRSKFFPPYDMWMAGKTINYYYFGHYIAAFLTKLSGLDSALTYNLMIATIFAFTFGLAFSLAGNLIFHRQKEKIFSSKTWKSVIFFGLLTAFLLTLGGNLHTLYWYLTHNFSFKDYWYPDATRFIEIKFGARDNTIHEFPIYSFVVADLHGHLNNLPFILFFIALCYSLFVSGKEKFFAPLIGLNLAVSSMTNSWDFPIYLLFFGFLSLFFALKKEVKEKREIGERVFLIIKEIVSVLLPPFILALIFILPFLIHFHYPGEGIDFVKARTPLLHLSVLWGWQFFVSICFFGFLAKKLVKRKLIENPEIFVFVLILTAFILVLLPEIIYLKDIYGFEYHRSNTMFKLVYQAFMMLALSAGFIIYLVSTKIENWWIKIFPLAIFGIFLIFILIYPWFAIKSYYGNIFKLENYQGLYGLNFLANLYPDDYKAILWLKENIEGRVGVLEAAGDSFTDYNRVSAVTGLPTIQGWFVHEWFWRGSFDEAGERAGIVQKIYETELAQEALELLAKYKMEYVFVGVKEREKYQVFEEKFLEIGRPVFRSGNTVIYKINL